MSVLFLKLQWNMLIRLSNLLKVRTFQLREIIFSKSQRVKKTLRIKIMPQNKVLQNKIACPFADLTFQISPLSSSNPPKTMNLIEVVQTRDYTTKLLRRILIPQLLKTGFPKIVTIRILELAQA